MNNFEYKKRHKFIYDYVKITKLWVMNVLLRPKYYYEDKATQNRIIDDKAIIICNHQSWIDIIQLLLAFPRRRLRFLVAKEATRNKFAAFFLKCFGAIPIERQKIDIEAINQAKKVLESGSVLVIFPEGCINDSGVLNQFKAGVSVLSMTTNTKIIPVYASPRNKWYARRKAIIGKSILPSDVLANNNFSIKSADIIATHLFNKLSELKTIIDYQSLMKNKREIVANEEST